MLPTAPEAPMIEMLVDMPELCEGLLPDVKGHQGFSLANQEAVSWAIRFERTRRRIALRFTSRANC